MLFNQTDWFDLKHLSLAGNAFHIHFNVRYVIGQTIIFSSCSFFLLLLLFFPRLISAVGDWMFTILWHMVWP